jgi:hypothetical protein
MSITLSFDNLLSHRYEFDAYLKGACPLSKEDTDAMDHSENLTSLADTLASVARSVGDVALTVLKKIPAVIGHALETTHLASLMYVPFALRDMIIDITALIKSDAKGRARSEEVIDSFLDLASNFSTLLDTAGKVMTVFITFAKLTGRVVKACNVLGYVSTLIGLVTLVVDVRTLTKCFQAYRKANEITDPDAKYALKERIVIGGVCTAISLVTTVVGFVAMAILLFTPFNTAAVVIFAVIAGVGLITFAIEWGADIQLKSALAHVKVAAPAA